MKALVLVDNIQSVPKKFREGNNLLVVTQSNWQETFHFLEGKTKDVYLFLHENCPIERLLKLVENYKGNLAVYTSQLVDSVFLSRFTDIKSRRTITPNKDFAAPTDLEKTLKHLKSVLD